MYSIDSVKIEGFWGQYKVETKFNEDVNIFIGKNGTGKTTFIHFLQSVLEVDIIRLSKLEFKKVVIKLVDKKQFRTVSVEKEVVSNLGLDFAIYRISRKPYKIPLYDPEIESRRFAHSKKGMMDYDVLKASLSKMVNISSLSVYRTPSFDLLEEEEFYYKRKRFSSVAPIERKLNDLLLQFTSYQVTLADEASKISLGFQKEVLTSTLYNKDFDTYKSLGKLEIEVDEVKKGLMNAYRELGILDKTLEDKIEEHIEALRRSVNKIKEKELTVDVVMPLSLLQRTQNIIHLSLSADEKRKEIFRPVTNFIDILKKFIPNKEIRISKNGNIEFIINNKTIEINTLSSGEKQLLVLFIEILLQKNKFFIFIADEPELSLHIEWQSQIINSIKQLNPNTQIILATHSPEITAGYENNIFDMEDIVNG